MSLTTPVTPVSLDLGRDVIAGVNDTGGQFATSVNDTGGTPLERRIFLRIFLKMEKNGVKGNIGSPGEAD